MEVREFTACQFMWTQKNHGLEERCETENDIFLIQKCNARLMLSFKKQTLNCFWHTLNIPRDFYSFLFFFFLRRVMCPKFFSNFSFTVLVMFITIDAHRFMHMIVCHLLYTNMYRTSGLLLLFFFYLDPAMFPGALPSARATTWLNSETLALSQRFPLPHAPIGVIHSDTNLPHDCFPSA